MGVLMGAIEGERPLRRLAFRRFRRGDEGTVSALAGSGAEGPECGA